MERGGLRTVLLATIMLTVMVVRADYYGSAPNPSAAHTAEPASGRCIAKCGLKCLITSRLNPVLYGLCFGLCMMKCEFSPPPMVYDCTRDCAHSKNVVFTNSMEGFSAAERFVDSCYKECKKQL